MSGGHKVHVHGAHDHAVEHAAAGGGLAQSVAIFSALLATIGAVVSMLGGHTQNEALYFKNEAVLKKAEASNMWNYYQAKSMKENLAEFAATLSADPTKGEFYRAEARRYNAEKKEIQKKAEALDKESQASDEKSKRALHPHEKLAMSITLLQIAIALASITVLTNKKWLLYGAAAAALVGCGYGIAAYLPIAH
jgi:hypothetical protein